MQRRGHCLEPVGIDRVVLRAASCFNRDQTRALELSEVARYGRLGDAEATHDLLGVKLPFEQQIEHLQARWIGEGAGSVEQIHLTVDRMAIGRGQWRRRRSTRLNSSHLVISYAV